MRFTILSHAGLFVEHRGRSVLCDPWLIGSCYWRSWWNYPEPGRELIDNLKPDYIYLSHIHWDHFHGPSLRLFPRNTPILIPKFPPRQMAVDLNSLAFRNVQEIPHGDRVELGPDFHLYSYHFGVVSDSAVVLTNDAVTILNVNDCKTFGLPLQQIRAKFRTFDFVLRSHSNARVLPYCLEEFEKYSFRSKHDYVADFTNFCLSMNARCAVPFASNHCFLHRDTDRFNSTAVRPSEIVDHYARRAREEAVDSKVVIMPTGSSWSEEDGFRLYEFNYDNGAAYIAHMKEKYADKLQRQYHLEEDEIFDEEAFRTYFEKFVRAWPWLLARIKPLRITFKIHDKHRDHYWLVDFRNRIVEPVQESDFFEVMIEMQAKVVNDCVKDLFRVWGPSKRVKVRLGDEKYVRQIQYFLTCLDCYENDVLPLWKNLRPRSLSTRVRRWREIVEALRLLIKHKVCGQPLVVADLYLDPSRKGRGRASADKAASRSSSARVCQACWIGCSLEEPDKAVGEECNCEEAGNGDSSDEHAFEDATTGKGAGSRAK